VNFEIIRRAGEETRAKGTRINAGACIEFGGVFFTTDEPEDRARAAVHNAALGLIAAALRSAGHQEVRIK
jgi:hypothetical protein